MIKRVNFFGDCVADYDLRECPYCGAGRQAPKQLNNRWVMGQKSIHHHSNQQNALAGRSSRSEIDEVNWTADDRHQGK